MESNLLLILLEPLFHHSGHVMTAVLLIARSIFRFFFFVIIQESGTKEMFRIENLH